MQASITGLILAAGKGTRMKSRTPKVLHEVCGVPILQRVHNALAEASVPRSVVVLGEENSGFDAFLSGPAAPQAVVIQHNRLGTGDAVAAAYCAFQGVEMPSFTKGSLRQGQAISSDYVLVTAADTPALNPQVLKEFVNQTIEQGAELAVLGMQQPQPFGYGRLIVEGGQLQAIVEEKDASPSEKRITLCNSGVVLAKTKSLFACLNVIDNHNEQREYYLTDCFKVARQQKRATFVFETDDYQSFAGVNNRMQLSEIENYLQDKIRKKWMLEGVTFRLAETCYLEESVELASDVLLYPGCCLTGRTKIASGAIIESHCQLHNATIEENTVVKAGTYIKN